uniref:Uncharacterized protein n=1 Tax=Schlesneria paludicola TaxID=360056 RepID=A0A7C2JZV7_9PLAN
MSPRRHLLFAYGLAALCAGWAIWTGVDCAIEGIHASFANEQTEIFAEMRAKAVGSGSYDAAQCLDGVVGYYPSGTKQVTGSRLDRIVERARGEAVAAIIAHLRQVTGEDWGDDPQAWIARYASGVGKP